MFRMDNPEEVMHCLEEFSKVKPKDIPRELDDYLGYVAKTGDPVFKWSIIKGFFREKLLNVITDFYESTLTMELPPCPNVDPFNYERMKASLLEKFDSFHGAPFTVQRICELLTNPRKEYKRADKFMRAIEKNILVVSIREPGRQGEIENDQQDSSFNGMPESNDTSIVSSTFRCSAIPISTPTYEIVDSETHIHNSLKPNVMDSLPQTVIVQEESSDDKINSEKTEDKSEPSVAGSNVVPDEVSSVEKDTESVICSTININAPGDIKPDSINSNEVSNIETFPSPQPMITSATQEETSATTNDVNMSDHLASSSSAGLESEGNVPDSKIQSEPDANLETDSFPETSNQSPPASVNSSVLESKNNIISEVANESPSEVTGDTSIPEIDSVSAPELPSETEASVQENVNNVDTVPKVQCDETLELKDLVESNECEEPVLSSEIVNSDVPTESSDSQTLETNSLMEDNSIECDTSNGVENKTVELETTSEAETKSDGLEMHVDSQEAGLGNNINEPESNSVVPMIETEENEVSESVSSVHNTDEITEVLIDTCDSSRETSVIHATSSEENIDSMEVDSQSSSNE